MPDTVPIDVIPATPEPSSEAPGAAMRLAELMVETCDLREKKKLNPMRASRAAIAFESWRHTIRDLLLPLAKKLAVEVRRLEEERVALIERAEAAERKLASKSVTRCQKCGTEALPSPTHALDLEEELRTAKADLEDETQEIADILGGDTDGFTGPADHVRSVVGNLRDQLAAWESHREAALVHLAKLDASAENVPNRLRAAQELRAVLSSMPPRTQEPEGTDA